MVSVYKILIFLYIILFLILSLSGGQNGRQACAEAINICHEDVTVNVQIQKEQIDQYNESKPKTIIELQQFRQTQEISAENTNGQYGKATLVNLNPFVNVEYILTLTWDDAGVKKTYHLENVHPDTQCLRLDSEYPKGIIIKDASGDHSYDLWTELSVIETSQEDLKIYNPLCDGRLWLKNKTDGHKTTKEWAVDFVRDYVWSGDQITNMVKGFFFKDSYVKAPREYSTGSPFPEISRNRLTDGPGPPLINPIYQNNYFASTELGIPLVNEDPTKLKVGRWYAVDNIPGIFVNLIRPRHVSEDLSHQLKKQLSPLDEVEQSSLVYIVAFDLNRYETGFSMGTDHPRAGWSERIQPKMRDSSLPGPDGIDNYAPLVNTGILSPEQVDQVSATFVGGFKRYHGVFRYSDLAWKNNGSHYGCIENGVVMSKLQPGLSTIIMYINGQVDMKTWSEADNIALKDIRHARQNGVPIVDYDPVNSVSKPGRMVRNTSGNWSGSVDGRYRTLRSGVALQEYNGRRFLIYGCFSSATPSSMALVFQAFQCKYAMLLDMSALEHTYLAVYRTQDDRVMPYYLIKGMNSVDKVYKNTIIPRFVGSADNRDFFYILKKNTE